MKNITLLSLILALMLGACAPFIITGSTGEQPTPIVETDESVSDYVLGYRLVTVDQAQVEVGTGSPIPVFVTVAGALPDTCAQLDYVQQKLEGSTFVIKLGTLPSTAENCIQDAIPFRITLPLNVVGLPAGSYDVDVNGSRATFNLGAGDPGAELRPADAPFSLDDIQVDNVSMEIGYGSPIPVHAVVSGNLPIACAQLGEIRLHRDGTTFFVQLVSYLPEQTDCPQDTIPFRLEIPLNTVNLPAGTYTVVVNGATTTFDLPFE